MRPNGCSGKLCPMQVGAADNCELTKEQCPYFTQDIDYKKVFESIKNEVAKNTLLEFKKLIHNKAVYTNSQDIPNYIQLKVFDAIPQNYINNLK